MGPEDVLSESTELHIHIHMEKFLERLRSPARDDSPLHDAATLVRGLTPGEVERLALEMQEFDIEGPTVVTCVLRVVAEVLDAVGSGATA